MDVEVEQPLAHLISHMISGVTAQIAIKVYGDDLDTLREDRPNQIKAAIAGVPGVSPPAVEPIRRVDEVHIRLRPDDLAFYGVDRALRRPSSCRRRCRARSCRRWSRGSGGSTCVVRLEEPYRSRRARSSAQLRLDLPDGRGQVRLERPGRHHAATGGDAGPNQVKRENVRRRIVIRCNALGRDLGGVVADIQRRVRRTRADCRRATSSSTAGSSRASSGRRG